MTTIARMVGALMLGLLGGLGIAARAQEPPGSAAWHRAQEDYAIGHYAEAYAGFAHLADAGREDAARIALQMHRFGPMLYRQSFTASREQLGQWRRTIDRAARGEPSLLAGDRAR